MSSPRDIKLFFSSPSQKYKVLKSLEIEASREYLNSALDMLESAAHELKADAIVLKSAPSAAQLKHGPLRGDAIQFLT